MRVAIEGCAHGELDIIYDTIKEMEKADGKKIDLLICCGDFQSTRNLSDLNCMAVPDKYKDMCTFYKYYSGEKIAPVLTIFIGGNHEASNYLQELPYGGWVAHNIYYLGYASVITVGGIRIAGLSGIYKGQHFMQGHYERAPYTDKTIRSVYHIRNLEVFRLKQLTGQIHIFLSHDWPAGITQYGDENALLKGKPFFRADIESNSLGSPPCMELLERHYPTYWFSAHLHCKFAAVVPEKGGTKTTKFLALDKCLPRRKFLQVLDIEHNIDIPLELHYDLEWLTILYLTNHLLSVKSGIHYMPGQCGSSRWIFTPTTEENEKTLNKLNNDLKIPLNFVQSAIAYDPKMPNSSNTSPQLLINSQTTQFCEVLGIDDPSVLMQILTNTKDCSLNESSTNTSFDSMQDSNEIPISYEDNNLLNTSSRNDSTSNTTSRVSVSDVSNKSNSEEQSMEYVDSNTETNDDNGSENVTNVDSTDDCNNASGQIEPNCKKFKRRNHSMYSNTL